MDPTWTSHSFDMLGALTGVLLLIFAVAWLLRRLQQSQSNGRAYLKIVSILPLSTKERVILVQAGDEQVLMGVSSAGIQHLHTLKEPIDPNQLEVGNTQGVATPMSNFADQLRAVMSRSRP